MFIYITYDTEGFITAYQNTEADGYTKVFILDSWITQFAQHSDKFRYDVDTNVILNPGNLPKVSLDQLNTDFTNIKEATDQYRKNNDSSNQSVSAVLSQLAQGQSQLALQTSQALKAISLAVAAKTATTTQTTTTTDNQEVK